MMTMLALYKTTLFAGAAMAGALSLIGMQLAARDRAMQTVCVGQGASVGVIFGLGLFHWIGEHGTEGSWSALPLLCGLLFSMATLWLSGRLVEGRIASKNTVFAFVFALLIALSHLLGSLFPGLETHLTQIYLGDLSTLTETNSRIAAIIGVAAMWFLWRGLKPITLASFDGHLVGDKRVLNRDNLYVRGFWVVALLVICLSVQFLGFLFTIACLFLPTAMFSFFRRAGLRRHLFQCVGSSVVAAFGGFLLSLQFTRLPTVPSVVLVLFLIILTDYLVSRAWGTSPK